MDRKGNLLSGYGLCGLQHLLLIPVVLSLFALMGLLNSCASPASEPGATSVQATATGTDVPVEPPSASATQPPAPSVEASTPLTAELKATAVAGLDLPTIPGAAGVSLLALNATGAGQPVWAVFTTGMVPDGHSMALYTYDDSGWQELARHVFTHCVQYVDDRSVSQVWLESDDLWLQMQAGTGAHGGCYELVRFDGQQLRRETSNLSASPDAGYLADLDGDGILEVILDQTDYYVFCYACGIRYPGFRVLRWDGTQLVPLALADLPASATAGARDPNNRAVALAQGGLWKDAQDAILQAQSFQIQDLNLATTIGHNAALIDLHARAAAQQAREGPYPLLDHILFGDYDAAVDVMRAHTVDEIWGPQTPLISGTAAEGWEFELTQWISRTTNLALRAEPDLAAAYFIRGWGRHLRDPGHSEAVADVERAAQLAPGDLLFTSGAEFLQVPISLGPPEEMVAFQPLPPDVCYDLGLAIRQTLNLTVTLVQASFADEIRGGDGTGCQATVSGTGENFKNVGEPADVLRRMLGARGWSEDMTYAADGPTGTAGAFRQNEDLCLLIVNWVPSPGVTCPSDRPIAECEVEPGQQLYTVQLNCAQPARADGPASPPLPPAEPTSPPPPPAEPTSTPAARAKPTPTLPPAGEATTSPAVQWVVRTLLAGPGQPGRLYTLLVDESTGAWPGGRASLLVSEDDGGTWQPFEGGLPAVGCIRNVNLDYATVDGLYASTCGGLYRWTGDDWLLISPRETGMVAIVYGNPQIIWGTEPFGPGGGVIRSDDGGASWQPAGYGLISFNGVANLGIDPRDPNTLYAIIWPKYAGSYLRRGTAQGLWQIMPTPLDNTTIGTGMTIDGGTGDLYVVAWDWQRAHHQLWRTSNPSVADVSQVAWEFVHDFGADAQVELLASRSGPGRLELYASISAIKHLEGSAVEIGPAMVHRSPDGGQTWAPLEIPEPEAGGR